MQRTKNDTVLWHIAMPVKGVGFNFTAEGGHTYTFALSKSEFCLNLLDVTADGHVVACEPYFSGRYNDLSTGDDTAIIRAGGASSDKGGCKPSRGETRYDFMEVDAGLIGINATCFTAFFGRPSSTSRFDFVAEAGHTYTFTATDKECISLIDITSEETVIACEPYEQVE